MPSENLETVRRAIAATNRMDPDGVLAEYAPDAKLLMPLEGPSPGTHQGHDAVRRFLEDFFSGWSELAVEIDELIPHGERVIALVRWRGVGRTNALEVAQEAAFSHVLRDGKIASIALFPDRERALEAAGITSASKA